MKTKEKKTLGRHDLQGAREPANGYAILPRSRHNSRQKVAIVGVADPLSTTGKDRIRALARLDLLDQERKHGLIDEASFHAGRDVERALESGSRVGCGGQWREGDRVDAATAHELAIVAGVERAQAVNKFLAWARKVVGRENAKVLIRVLRDRWNYKQVAAEQLKFGERGQREIALRFRIALELLAEAKAAQGDDRSKIRAYHAATEETPE